MVPTAGSKCTRRGSRIRRVGKSGQRGHSRYACGVPELTRRVGKRGSGALVCGRVEVIGHRARVTATLRAHGHLTVFVFSHGLIDFDFILFD
jgi:hypothetical protein